MSDKLKKVLKIIALPITALVTFILTSLSLKNKRPSNEIKKEISDIKKKISDVEKQIDVSEKDLNDKKEKLDKAVDETKKTISENLSDKETRDKSSEKFFR